MIRIKDLDPDNSLVYENPWVYLFWCLCQINFIHYIDTKPDTVTNPYIIVLNMDTLKSTAKRNIYHYLLLTKTMKK